MMAVSDASCIMPTEWANRLTPAVYLGAPNRGEFEDADEERYVWKHCAVIFAKDDVATIFARSPRGQKEFPEFVINQRAAVGLARYVQDPLVEFAGEGGLQVWGRAARHWVACHQGRFPLGSRLDPASVALLPLCPWALASRALTTISCAVFIVHSVVFGPLC